MTKAKSRQNGIGRDGKRLLSRISLENLLSFGPDPVSIALEPLNVLIGPNASGKSNLIEAISLIRSTPISDAASSNGLRGVIRRGGGAGEWIWKGAPARPALIDVVALNSSQNIRHVLSFSSPGASFSLEDERIENERPDEGESDAYFYYRFQHGKPVVNTKSGKKRQLARESVDPDQSILAQRRDPELYPEIAHLANAYEGIRIYREWSFGRNTVFREPQRADMRNDRLEEDFSNLGLFLSRLRKFPKAKAEILTALKDLYEGVSDFEPVVEGGTVQVFFSEGDFSIPATRLSDGTLRYLCLLAILCDPEPPPLICIEEPELGLHPDILPKLSDLLVHASQKTQLIVTTHSDILIDALTERPESVVVCEKHQGRTELRRLTVEDLKPWLENYRLGQLWSKGEIGGNRW